MIDSRGTPGDTIADSLLAHEARNRALLERLQELGVALELPRLVDCHFWAPNRETAGVLIEKLLERGFMNLAATPPRAEDNMWSVEGQLNESPQFVASPRTTEELVTLAAEIGTEYDGWGTLAPEAGASPS